MKIVIIGGGLTGLSCAYKLQQKKIDFLLIEKNKQLGGLCRSVKINNFIFDYTGHFLHFHESKIKKFVKKLLDKNLLEISRKAKIYTQYATTTNHLIPYPFQANIGFLEPKIIKECISELIKSQLKNTSVLKTKNFYSWLLNNFGSAITRYFFLPYNTKLWNYKLTEISTDWAEKFVPIPNVEQIMNNIINLTTQKFGYNTTFFYPKHGGIQSLINSIAKCVNKTNVLTQKSVEKIDYKKKVLYLSSKETVSYDVLISTIPLNNLVKITNLPNKIKFLANKLRYVAVVCFNIALKTSNMKNVHWIYFPQKEFVFYRVGFYHNINPTLVPENKASLYVEVSYPPNKIISVNSLYEDVIKGLKFAKIISSKKDILFYNVLYIPCAYVIYDFARNTVVKYIKNYLESNNIFSIGRYGAWKYSYMEENIKDAFDTIDFILTQKK